MARVEGQDVTASLPYGHFGRDVAASMDDPPDEILPIVPVSKRPAKATRSRGWAT